MDLKKFMEEEKTIDKDKIRHIMFQIVSATLYLHSSKVLHRDLKPQNILIDPSNCFVKLADFGLSRCYTVPIKPYTKEVLTLWYRAPELILGSDQYSTAIDIWSIGCIFAELFTKRPLFKGDSEIGQLYEIFK